MIRTIVLFALLSVLSPSMARMYQWSEPDNGKTHLSGNPPAWYRSGEGGPRVFVFQKGQLIDDTAIEVDEQRRQSLRQQALIEAAENRAAANEEAKQAAMLNQQLPASATALPPKPPLADTREAPLEAVAGAAEALGEMSEDGEEAGKESKLTAEQVAELRALVAGWEAQNVITIQNEATPEPRTDAPADSAPNITREQLLDYLERAPAP